MTFANLWDVVWPYIATIALALASGLTLVGLAPQFLGERLFGHFLERRLSSFKHEQDKEIEALKAKLSRIGDRGLRSNEREYGAVIAAWEAFVDAYIFTQNCVMQFISHPDFRGMSSEKVAEYLETTEFSPPQKKQVLEANDKNDIFGKLVRLRYISRAGAAIFDARSILRKQGIFIPEELEANFESALQLMSQAQVHQQVSFDHGYFRDEMETTQRLFKEGPEIFSKLKAEVRSRIFLVD